MKEMIVTYKLDSEKNFRAFRGTFSEAEIYFKTHALAGYKISFGPNYILV